MTKTIPLQKIEDFIEPEIIKRGLSYYRDDCVYNVNDDGNGNFDAIVSGSDDYEVEITILDGNITKHSCDCPYEYGDFCKHEVATLFYLKHHFFTKELEILSDKKSKETPPKTPTIDKIIEKVSIEDLKKFVIEECKNNNNLKVAFVTKFLSNAGKDSKENYVSQLHSLFRSHSGRHHFIDYYEMRKLSKPLNNFIETIEKHLETGNIRTAFNMSCAMLEVGIEQINHSDDSNGELGGCIEEAISTLYQIAVLENQDDLKKELSAFCLEKFENNNFKGWDWHFDMLRIAEKTAKNQSDYELILEKIENGNFSKDYWKETSQELQYKILLKIDTRKAQEFLNRNMANSKLRALAIDLEIKNFNYEKAKNLSLDGIKYDAKDKPGLVSEWHQWLLKIAKLTNDTEKIIEYSRWLFLDNFRNDEDYYKTMKANIPNEKWKIFTEDLLKDLKNSKKYRSAELIPKIFVEEQQWEKLLVYLKENLSVYKLDYYEKYLSKDYPNEISDLYGKAVVDMLEQASNRNQYKEACKYLQKIKKMGFPEKANQLVVFSQKTYPKRKALMEELAKI